MSIQEWFMLSDPREQRRYLEAHLELLSSTSEQFLRERIVQHGQDRGLLVWLQRDLSILQDSLARGGTAKAVRDAFVNMYGGLVLEMPVWMEEVVQKLHYYNRTVPSEPTKGLRLTYLQSVLGLDTLVNDPHVPPEARAELRYQHATTLLEGNIGPHKEQLLHDAIALCCLALQGYPYERYPYRYALVHMALAYAYQQAGTEREANVRQEIVHCEEALQALPLPIASAQWAAVHCRLGDIYLYHLAGEEKLRQEPAIAHYKAALPIFTRDAYPEQWAGIQKRLGEICERWLKDPEYVHIEQAIAYYKAARQVYNSTSFPAEWAYMQLRLGCAYKKRHPKEWHENVERSLAYFEAALQVYKYETFPEQWALIQQNLGMAYAERFAGKKWLNQEKALVYCNAALRVYRRETFPDNYAELQMNLGARYQERIMGDRRENQEHAIACYTNTLQIHTREAFPRKWAMTQNNLGSLYEERLAGDRATNQEQAFRHYNAALQVHTREAFPINWAQTHHNLAILYSARINGKREANLTKAVTCCQKALEIRILTAFPDSHGRTQFRLALIEAERQRWVQVHEALTQFRKAQDLLLAISVGVTGRDTLLDHGRTANVHEGFALVRLGDFAGAAVAIERGRARNLAEALNLNSTHPDQIQDIALRDRYIEARQAFLHIQTQLNALTLPEQPMNEQRFHFIDLTERCRKAKEAFDQVINEIRIAHDPVDFLEETVDASTILQAASQGGHDHALVYLAATAWGGIAVAALGSHPKQPMKFRFRSLELPLLTEACLNELIHMQVEGKITYMVSGFAYAQLEQGFDVLCSQWSGDTFHENAMRMFVTCAAEKRASTLSQAAQQVLHMPKFSQTVELPLAGLRAASKRALRRALNRCFLQLELQRCLSVLAKVALEPLMVWLQEQGVKSLTLIPCGTLGAFPLPSALLENGYTWGEMLPTSVAPNARSLLRSAPLSEEGRFGVYALGDPPTHVPLQWGEEEAHVLAKLARSLQRPGVAKVRWEATRYWLLPALQKGYVVDASCHGYFSPEAPLESALILAEEQYLKLGELLSHSVDIRGLRLLILSACQTAIVHLQRTPDEVRSLAAGMVQAGALAVLAALWSVDDRATYLLMVRFAQEWFPHMDDEPPVFAFVRAQSWLRTVTNGKLAEWEADILRPTEDERRDAGAPRRSYPTPQTSEVTNLLVVGRESDDRYDSIQAEDKIQAFIKEQQQLDPNACPYADPVYWAGFQITGW